MKLLLMIFGWLVFVSYAHAEPSCYAPAELEAEQLLRLHSELMVITVTCRQSSDGESLVPAYTDFTKRNISALHGAENTIKAYYDNHGGSGEDRLDKMRTKMGNEFGQKIADMSAPRFCDAYRDKVISYSRASSSDVSNEVQRMEASVHSYGELCGSKAQVAKTNH